MLLVATQESAPGVQDVDGLRALRGALPAHLAGQASKAGAEPLDVDRVAQYVDEVTLPLVTGVEQNALMARTQLAASGPGSMPRCPTSAPDPRWPTEWRWPTQRPTGSGGSTRARAA